MQIFLQKYLFPICALFLVFGCSSKQENKETVPEVNWRDSLKVGMTYEEVEKILGKPVDISRGASRLEDEDENIRGLGKTELETRLAELEFIQKVMDSTKNERLVAFRKSVKTTGQLIYVNWKYLGSRFDTATVIEPTWVNAHLNSREEYFVNGVEVSRVDFDLSPPNWIFPQPRAIPRVGSLPGPSSTTL